MKLRDYQTATISQLRKALAAGYKRPVVQAPTGAGKTVIGAAVIKMAREKGKKVIFAVPALTLIDQTVERFRQNGITEIGVIQAQHEMTDPSQPVQVCSVQTLARRQIPLVDLVIVDECHLMFQLYDTWMNLPEWKKVPFVGLTATPWSKGMGAEGRWDHLIVATTTTALIEEGSLSDFRVYAPAHPDLNGVKTVAGDYELRSLGAAMDKGELVADIVTTWLERAENRPTICFCVNRVHAKHVQEQFKASGVEAEYLDAYTDLEKRGQIFEKFKDGSVKVLCNVGVLTTGFDADVRCIVLARPTKSEILYTQMIGRGLRPAKGKKDCLILDHSDTTLRLGFVTDIHHEELDDGKVKRTASERSVPLPKECPKCSFVKPLKAHVCPSCGFKPEPKVKVNTVHGDLYELTRNKSIKPHDWDYSAKQEFYSQLLLHAQLRGYKKAWAFYAYRDKFKEPPDRSLREVPAKMMSPVVDSWIRARNIRKAKAKEKGRAA